MTASRAFQTTRNEKETIFSLELFLVAQISSRNDISSCFFWIEVGGEDSFTRYSGNRRTSSKFTIGLIENCLVRLSFSCRTFSGGGDCRPIPKWAKFSIVSTKIHKNYDETSCGRVFLAFSRMTWRGIWGMNSRTQISYRRLQLPPSNANQLRALHKHPHVSFIPDNVKKRRKTKWEKE
jgi:hypothetical protein